MLDLDHPDRELPRDLLRARGGFAWWYADLFDDTGSGLVCIWSYGLPFLPGYMSANRRDEAPMAGQQASINLAVYDRGKPVAYTLLRLDEARARWGDRTWQFGDSTFEFERGSTRVQLLANLDLPVPGSEERLTGRFHIEGPRVQPHDATTANPVHSWSPLAGPSTATATIRVGDETLIDVEGSGYHDRNGSPHAMDALGLEHWIWTRQILGEDLVITYLNFPDNARSPYHTVVRITPQGELRREDVEVTLEHPKTATFGMPWWTDVTIEGLAEGPLHQRFARPFDDSPFYLRTWVDSRQGGHRARGIAELCRPHRIDRAWHRPLVRMVVQREEGPQSMWLPLFAGPARTRMTRLLHHWGSR